jgi:hypothetical protein
MLTWLGLLTPIVIFFLNLFSKNETKKADLLAKFNKAVGQINAGTTDSVNTSSEYSKEEKEQEDRLNGKI